MSVQIGINRQNKENFKKFLKICFCGRKNTFFQKDKMFYIHKLFSSKIKFFLSLPGKEKLIKKIKNVIIHCKIINNLN